MPIPLPLVVPERHHATLLSAIHSCNNWAATHWAIVFGSVHCRCKEKESS